MSNYYPESDFLFGEFEQGGSSTESDWASLIFVNPLTAVPRLSPSSSYSEPINDRELVALYNDWQTRDSEIGYALVEQRQKALRSALEVFRVGLDSRQRRLTSARARMQTLTRINATEPDTKLHYPKRMIDELAAEIQIAEVEHDFLRLYVSRMSALYCVLQTVSSTGQGEMLERYCRLIGRAWRGLMKLRSFKVKFPGLAAATQASEGFAPGVIIGGSAHESPFATDLVIPYEAVSYLKFLLGVIAKLSEKAQGIFNPAEQREQLTNDWPPAMQLLSAIVELFYFCSFEMPVSSHIRAVEKTSPDKVWEYAEDGWRQFNEQAIERTRRQAAETAQLLVEAPPFLRCNSAEDISNLCQAAIRNWQPEQPYGPYQSTGLAKIEDRSDNRTLRSKTAGPMIGSVLEVIVAAAPELQPYFYTGCGGPIQTLLGMANLDQRAYRFGDQPELLQRQLALKFLSEFWKRMGKQRPVALLGEGYARQIYTGLSSIGEAAPERSSLLSIHLTNVLGKTIFGSGQATGPVDMLTVLMLADQIRLMDLLELSWQYTQQFLEQLKQVRSLSEIGELLRSGRGYSALEPEIAKRFNPKWSSSTQPLWIVLRSSAPQAWRFWTTLAEGKTVAETLSRLEPGQALSSLFLPLAEIVRLMLLLETSSPVLAERLKVDSETAATELLYGFTPFKSWPAPFGSLIDECIGYYFDQSIQHDAWLAFTESLKTHLRQQEEDLKMREAGEPILEVLVNMMVRLEANHPTPQKVTQTGSLKPLAEDGFIEVSLPDAELTEADCQIINQTITDLGNRRKPTAFLKLISLWRYSEVREGARQISRFRNQLAQYITDPDSIGALTGSPWVISNAGRTLSGLTTPSLDSERLHSVQQILKEYNEIQRQFEALVAVAPIPFPDDRELIDSISTKTDQSRVALVMVCIFDTLSLLVVREGGVSQALTRFEMFLEERTRGASEVWRQELTPIGFLELYASSSGLSLGNSLKDADPIFYDPDKQQTSRLMWSYASQKLNRALKILQAQLTDSIISIRL